jgi:circadian clock protein KaiB
MATYQFQLYIAGDAQNSMLAVANLRAFCLKYLPEQYEIEIVDVFRQPERALAESIFMTPTLVRRAPAPARRIVGTLSQTQPILQAMGLEDLAA